MTPLSRALEQFDEKFGYLYDYTKKDPSVVADFDYESLKSFITDFYRQILEDDIDRLEKKIEEERQAKPADEGEKLYEFGLIIALVHEITHKKQLLKELEWHQQSHLL